MSSPDPSGIHDLPGRKRLKGTPLERLLRTRDDPDAVTRAQIGLGDTLVITTRNSVYSLCALGQGIFAVSGGWFEQQGSSPQREQVNGCTFGGSAIRHDLIAAPGLFLEFANGVKTTRITSVRLIPAVTSGQPH